MNSGKQYFFDELLSQISLAERLVLSQGWTETYVQWSPHGTYLATFHQKGIAVWGGSDFRRLQRFNHSGVQLIDFSPCER